VSTENAKAIADRFERIARELRATTRNGQRAHSQGWLKQTDVDHLFTSTFLGIVASFEVCLEDLFYSAVLGQSGLEDVSPRMSIPSRTGVERVLGVNNGDRYLNWTSIKESRKRAEAFIAGGAPFNRLQGRAQDNEIVQTSFVVRNAIAHKSGAARRKFQKLPLAGLFTTRRSPAGFLQLMTGNVSQYEFLSLGLVRISKALTAPRRSTARKYLSQESSYRSGNKAPLGTYECASCSSRVLHRSKARALAPCKQCQKSCSSCGSQPKSDFRRVYPA